MNDSVLGFGLLVIGGVLMMTSFTAKKYPKERVYAFLLGSAFIIIAVLFLFFAQALLQ